MSQPNPTKPNPDDLLADFTDRVLDGKTSVLASPADHELRGLEETIMHLTQTFPQEVLDEKTFKRLQADFKVRARKVNSSSNKPVWQSQQSRQRLILVFTAVAILAVIFIALPLLTLGNGSTQATAGLQPGGAILLIAAGCIIVFLIWQGRHK